MSLEIKNHLEALNTEWRGFKSAHAARLDELQAQIDETQKAMQRRGPGIDREGPGGGSGAAEVKAFCNFLRSGIRAAMSTNDDPGGGYLVPTTLADQIAAMAANYSPMRKLASVVKSPRGNYTQLISTSDAAFEWRAEATAAAETTAPKFAALSLYHGEIASTVALTRHLAEDSEFNLLEWLIQNIGRAHGVGEGAAFANGNGILKPRGLLTYDSAVTADATRAFGVIERVHSGSSGSFDADDLIDTLYALASEYRANASWVMNPTTLAAVRKLKTSSGDFVWEAAAAAGQPSTLFGSPVYEDPNLPVPAADANVVLVGDFKRAYHVVDISSPVMIRDDITEKGLLKFYSAKCVGGMLVDSRAVKVLRLSA